LRFKEIVVCKEVFMDRGIGSFLWQISVALYLIANGVLGLTDKGGDFVVIYRAIFGRGDFITLLALVTSVIALIAGIAIILEIFHLELPFLDTLIFIVAIVWVVYIIMEIVSWITGEGSISFARDLWRVIQTLAVHLMVLGSLLVSSKQFDR
jgi:hypothetical protein